MTCHMACTSLAELGLSRWFPGTQWRERLPGGRTRRERIQCSPAPTVPGFLVSASLPPCPLGTPRLGRWARRRTLQRKGTLVSSSPPPFRHQETEAQRRSVTRPRSHSQLGAEPSKSHLSDSNTLRKWAERIFLPPLTAY